MGEGWLEDHGEEHAEVKKRPPRRYCTLTDKGRMDLGGVVRRAEGESRFAALRWFRRDGRVARRPGCLGRVRSRVVVCGFLPGILSLIDRMIRDMYRRRELQAELHEVLRWERPFWVAQHSEVAIRVGLFPEIGWLRGRHVWHHCELEFRRGESPALA